MIRIHNTLTKTRAALLLAVLAATTAGVGFWIANPVVSALAHDEIKPADLRGAKAVSRLKEEGTYESLQTAVKAARQNDLLDPQTKLTTADGEAGDRCGSDLAVSGDTAVLGCPWDTIGSNDRQGSAYVFVRSASGWMQQQKLTFSPAANEEFGSSVAIEGDTIVVGARSAQVGGSNGVGYVFTRAGTTWTHQQVLTGGGGAIKLGTSAAISGDTIVLGTDHSATSTSGKAVIYIRTGNTWQQQQVLEASDGAANDWFGLSVGISSDTIIVGAGMATVNNDAGRGAAYVFSRTGANWVEAQKLSAPDGLHDDQFGRSVDISGDKIAVGAPVDENLAAENRGVYIFAREASAWTFEQKLSPIGGHIVDSFGGAISIDGDNVLVGAYWHNVGANGRQGTVYHFQRLGTQWSQQRRLVASDGAEDDIFGAAVAIDGGLSVVGAISDDVAANPDQGSLYIFECQRSEQRQLVANDGAPFDQFGNAVAVSGDTAVVGAASEEDSSGGSSQGAVYVFARTSTGWAQQQKLTANPVINGAEFGHVVDISGNTIVVGAWRETVGTTDTQGAAYVFVRSGSTWTQQARLLASDGDFLDEFGAAVAIDGNTIAVGAPSDDTGGNANRGSVYVFVRSGSAWTQQTRFSSTDGANNDNFGNAVDISDESIAVGAFRKDNFRGAAYVFVRNGAVWTQQQALTASDGTAGDEFGYAVSIDGDTVAIGARKDDTDQVEDHGAVYIFRRNISTWTQQEKIGDEAPAPFTLLGYALSLDGDNLLVGQEGGQFAWLYARDGTIWSLSENFVGAPVSDFGEAVAIDGETILIGALARTVGGNSLQGEASIYYADCSSAPLGSGLPLTRRRCKAPTPATLGVVTDTHEPAANLTVSVQSVPPGITLTGLTNNNGTVTANVGADCTAALSLNLISLRVADSMGGGSTFNIPLIVHEQKASDFDGDNISDLSIWRPSDGNWYSLSSANSSVSVVNFGISTDKPAPADYDGDGRIDVAVWREGPPSQAAFYILNSSDLTVRTEAFGQTGDVPVAGDYDGDGKSDISVYRSGSQSTFFYRGSLSNPNGNISYVQWGTTGDIPVPASYGIDGKTDAAVYRNGVWWILHSTGQTVETRHWGTSGDTLVPADYDGDGKTDSAIFRNGQWWILESNSQTTRTVAWGLASDKLAPADYDGDGKADIAIFRSGTWWILRSQTNTTAARLFGQAGDIPVASAYVR